MGINRISYYKLRLGIHFGIIVSTGLTVHVPKVLCTVCTCLCSSATTEDHFLSF